MLFHLLIITHTCINAFIRTVHVFKVGRGEVSVGKSHSLFPKLAVTICVSNVLTNLASQTLFLIWLKFGVSVILVGGETYGKRAWSNAVLPLVSQSTEKGHRHFSVKRAGQFS